MTGSNTRAALTYEKSKETGLDERGKLPYEAVFTSPFGSTARNQSRRSKRPGRTRSHSEQRGRF